MEAFTGMLQCGQPHEAADLF